MFSGVIIVRLGMKKKSRKRIVFVLVLLIIALCAGLHIFLKRAEPAFVAQSSNYSNTAFTDLVNKCVINIAQTDEYSDFFEIITDDSNRITAIEANTSQINIIKSKLLIDIQNALNADYPAYLNIPLGSLSGYYLLSSIGPNIPVKVVPISIVNGTFDEEFVSVGINQVKHKIYLDISVDMLYSGYLLHETERIVTSVPIAETVISGDIPEYYGAGMAFSDSEDSDS